ncbi:hypothetical protein ACOME3_009505 [Neoechinorhynchus agilis]
MTSDKQHRLHIMDMFLSRVRVARFPPRLHERIDANWRFPRGISAVEMIPNVLYTRILSENARLLREQSYLKSLEVKANEKALPLCHKIWMMSEIRQRIMKIDSIETLLHEYYKVHQSFLVDGHQFNRARDNDQHSWGDTCEFFLLYLRTCSPKNVQSIFYHIGSSDQNVDSIWEALFASIYGSAFFIDDEQLILDTLISMVEAKEHRLLESIDTLLKLYIMNNRSTRAFLRSTLRQPVM